MIIFVLLFVDEIFHEDGAPVATLSTTTRTAAGIIEGGGPRRPGVQAHVQFLGRGDEKAKDTIIYK